MRQDQRLGQTVSVMQPKKNKKTTEEKQRKAFKTIRNNYEISERKKKTCAGKK